jgi:hypothetical protein
MTAALRIFVLGVVLASFLSTVAVAENDPHLNVIVRFSADLPLGLMTEAEETAKRVFDKAGVSTQWSNCPARAGEFVGDNCDTAPAPGNLVLHVVPRSRRSTDAVLGVAFVDGSSGAYADIFFDRVQQLHDQDRKISMATLLGSVFAHEIGHLLLGEHSHSPAGMMVGQWHRDELARIAKGNLLFDAKEAGRLRARVAELDTLQTMTTLASESGN